MTPTTFPARLATALALALPLCAGAATLYDGKRLATLVHEDSPTLALAARMLGRDLQAPVLLGPAARLPVAGHHPSRTAARTVGPRLPDRRAQYVDRKRGRHQTARIPDPLLPRPRLRPQAEWKRNVLSNTAVRTLSRPLLTAGRHRLQVYALEPGFVLDRIDIVPDGAPDHYGAPPG